MKVKTQTLYTKVIYGNNINKTKRKVDIEGCNWFNIVNLNKTKRQCILITANKNECEQIQPNTCTFDANVTDSIDETKRKVQLSNKMSRIVVLMVGVLAKSHEMDQSDVYFDESVRKNVKQCKPNIMAATSYQHHGSSGECFAFGNKANYGLIVNSSVSTFTTKKSKN